MKLPLSMLLMLPVLAVAAAGVAEEAAIPVLYTTDLYQPHDDPDDFYDLATLFAFPQFDIRGIIIDAGERGKDRPALTALRQMMYLTRRDVPVAVGLHENLRNPEDTAAAQPAATQDGVTLILKVLHESEAPVTLITAGSLRDVAAAFNRAPALFREKITRLYINAGWVGEKEEWNVNLDRAAYVRMLRSGLPVYWAPCFGESGWQTFWKFRQQDVLDALAPPLQNFFLYMLTKAETVEDPIVWLYRKPDPAAMETFWPQDRNMWCTAPFLHAAGGEDPSFTFCRLRVRLEDETGMTVPDEKGDLELETFHIEDEARYAAAMKNLLAEKLRALNTGIPPAP